MAVIDFNNQDWINGDGLYRKFGTDQATPRRAGEYQEAGSGRHVTEVVIDLLALSTRAPSAGTDEVIVADNVSIPVGAWIEEIRVFVTKETAGANATLDLGLVDFNDRTTEIDFDGLLTNYATINDGTDLGELTTLVKGTTGAGALVGTRLAKTGLLTASVDTADFTAGVVRIAVYWSFSLPADI